jgi:hypothetical protein
MRLVIDEDVAYEGGPIPVPRAGDVLRHGGEDRMVEAVTWELEKDDVSVTLLLAAQPYAY